MEPTHHDVHVPPSSTARGQGGPRRGRRQRGDRSEVRAIARAAGRTCSRPGCDTPAAATLVFSYQEQVARLVDLLEEGEPQAYDLCPAHADRTRPPMGWELSDTRPPPSDAPRRLDDDETVAVLAAALRGETPPTRVSVLEGGRTDEHDPDDEAPAASEDQPGIEDESDAVLGEEDPLRAALEELQRVAMPDDDVTAAAPATPLRREAPDGPDGSAVDAAEAPATPAVDVAEDPADAPAASIWDEVESARAASEEAGGCAGDLTLW